MNIPANKAYEANKKEVQEQIAKLQAMVERMSNTPAEEVHWGHAGDLAHVIDVLKNLNAFG